MTAHDTRAEKPRTRRDTTVKKTTLRIVAAVSVVGSTIVAAGMASGAATAP